MIDFANFDAPTVVPLKLAHINGLLQTGEINRKYNPDGVESLH